MASANVNERPTSSAINSDKTIRETRQKMMDDCEITWESIQEIHHRLASHKEKRPATMAERSNAVLKILQHKQKRLEAALDVLKKQDVEVVSKDLQFVETQLRDDMKISLVQLQETLVILKGQRLEVAGDIARESKLLEEQKAIQKSLEEKLKACRQIVESNQSPNSVLAELQSKKKEVVKYHATVMNQLGKFLSQHYPAPDDIDEEDLPDPKEFCSLQHITETLMNRLFESPHDCYIKILPTYWPPYIQLLLQSNVIQRHPDNCNLIRLVAFHA